MRALDISDSIATTQSATQLGPHAVGVARTANTLQKMLNKDKDGKKLDRDKDEKKLDRDKDEKKLDRDEDETKREMIRMGRS